MAKVLVTGSAGAIGVPVCRELARRGHQVRGLDRVESPELADSRVIELEDRAGVREAVRGMDVVVHLAAHPHDADLAELVGPNVLGLYHMLDAARREARRVVLASSIQALGHWDRLDRSEPASVDVANPANHYGLTKAWAETMGEMYAREHGLSVIAARVAFMVRDPEEARRLIRNRQYDLYLSRGDVGRFFAQAVEAPGVDFAVLYAVGRGGEHLFDMQPTSRAIGFEPRDRWPEGLGFELLDDAE
jgi:nucleoside-diphosphate-sugar epimerase